MRVFCVIQNFMKSIIKEGDPFIDRTDQVCIGILRLCALSSCLLFFYSLCFDPPFCNLFFPFRISSLQQFLISHFQSIDRPHLSIALPITFKAKQWYLFLFPFGWMSSNSLLSCLKVSILIIYNDNSGLQIIKDHTK